MHLPPARLHSLAQTHALTLPGTDIYSFTQGWQAARVAEKWFMLFSQLKGEPVVILKAPPEDVRGLLATYDFVHPGYHMNKNTGTPCTPTQNSPQTSSPNSSQTPT